MGNQRSCVEHTGSHLHFTLCREAVRVLGMMWPPTNQLIVDSIWCFTRRDFLEISDRALVRIAKSQPFRSEDPKGCAIEEQGSFWRSRCQDRQLESLGSLRSCRLKHSQDWDRAVQQFCRWYPMFLRSILRQKSQDDGSRWSLIGGHVAMPGVIVEEVYVSSISKSRCSPWEKILGDKNGNALMIRGHRCEPRISTVVP